MSYILDALKRSEQERHQGELNHTTIDTIMMPKKQASHHWWPYALIIVLCLNIFIFLYFQLVDNDDKSQVDVSSVEESVSHQENLDKQEVGTTYQSGGQKNQEKRLPDHLMQTPKLQKRFDVISQGVSHKAKEESTITNKVEASKQDSNGYDIIRPKGYSESSAPIKMPTAKYTPTKNYQVEEASEQNATVQVEPIPQEGSEDKAPPMESQAELVNFDAVSHLDDMEVAFQKQIPDIRFNSHIYSLTPSDRRVMINDLYLREGQDFSGVEIETIGEFYVILSKKNQRFKIPVLRDWYRPR